MRKSVLPKKVVVILLLITSLVTSGFSQTGKYQYNDSWGKPGLQLNEQRSSDVMLTYSIQDFSIAGKQINGEPMHEIVLSSHLLPNKAGAPNLPGNGYMLAIPNGATARVEITNSRVELIENVVMEPSPEIPWDTDKSPLRYIQDPSVYTKDAFYPAQPVIVSTPSALRGVNVVRLGITPYQYNPVTKQLKVYRDIKIQVIAEGGDGTYGTERLRSRWWDPILKNSIVNSQVLPEIDYAKQIAAARSSNEYEYLIITPNDPEFVAWADTISRFRNMQGIHTGAVTLGEIGGVNAIALEAYINSIYADWQTPPAAVLLLGDYGTNMNNTIISPIWDNYCVSDNILADVDNNSMPDIVFARITAQNGDQLKTMIKKFIDYETNPPTSFDFYDHPITALGWQTERWFQICSETVGGFWKNELGKHPIRINEVYEGNPEVDPWSTAPNTSGVMEYFGPNGVNYITETPGELGAWQGGNSDDINQAINQGSFMLQHRDHGNEVGWGEPGYNKGSINGLTNTDLTFVMSINCLTGKYNNSSEVFSEKFHRYTYGGHASGALGLIAASEVSYSFVNDAYVWGLYDYMWPDFMPDYGGNFPETHGTLPAFANAYGKIFLEYTGWPYNTGNKEVTYNLFHHHGDAFLNVYTEVPQELTIDHNEVILSGLPTFEITADAGSLICLSADGQIIAVAEGTGEPQVIPVDYIVPGTLVDLVITKQNYFRYHTQLLCVPPSGPYLLNIEKSFLNSNGSDFICFGDETYLSLKMKNVGTEAANNTVVTVSCDDQFIQLSDNTETYGTIEAEQEIMIENGFSFTVAGNIPDQHQVIFHVSAVSGETTWESEIEMTVNAPDIKVNFFHLTLVTGNSNGIVDAGETYEIQFDIQNQGHSATKSLVSSLFTENNFTRIYTDATSTETLPADSTMVVTFLFETDGNTPMGTEIILVNQNETGLYNAVDSVFVKVGVTVEDWETGDLTKFEWLNDQAHPWVVDHQVKYEGNFALRSADITASQMSILTLAYQVYSPDSVSFLIKSATLEGNGLINFIMDGQEKGSWSGEFDWTRVSYPVTTGKHTLIWMFIKFAESDDLEDCAWIDLITLPQVQTTTGWAGFDQDICDVPEIQLSGMATNYNSVLWSTQGSGSFDDPQVLNAVYSPSNDDISNGKFTLTLTVEGAGGTTVTDDQTLTILKSPEAAEILWTQDTVYTVLTTSSALTGGTAVYATDYNWTLSPETAGNITSNGQSATIVWNTLYSGEAAIGYQGFNMCEAGITTEKTVFVTNATSISELNDFKKLIIYPNPTQGSFYLSLELKEASAIQLTLLDGVGRTVWHQSITETATLQMQCQPGKLPPGIYQLIIVTEQQRLVRKVVVR